MKKTNTKKGFTIIELVIVIAVIGILAAVLIPTFSGVIEKANESAAMQAARNEYEVFLAEHAAELTGKENFVIVYKNTYAFEVKEGQFNATPVKNESEGTIPAHYDVDLTKVKSAKTGSASSGTVAAPTVDDNVTAGTFYKTLKCTETDKITTGFAAETTYYYLSNSTTADIGNADVAIYTKK